MKNTEVKQKKSFYYWIGVISDYLVYPIILIALISSFVMFSNKQKNKVPMLFGNAIVTVVSGSMRASGFDIGDSVIVQKTNTDNLRPGKTFGEGDIIAFYYAIDGYDSSMIDKHLITNFDSLPIEDSDTIDYQYRRTIDEITKIRTPVYFHEIKAVYINNEGIRFFQTQGTSNNGPDTSLVREDYVVGKYLKTGDTLRGFFKFCSGSMGIVMLVIVPLSVMICMQMLSLLEQVSIMLLEKKVLRKQVKFDHQECINSRIIEELRQNDKVYLYEVLTDEEKQRMYDYLLENIQQSKYKKAVKQYNQLELAKALYNINPDAYWSYFITTNKGYKQKQLIKQQAKAYEFNYLVKSGKHVVVYDNLEKEKKDDRVRNKK